MSVGPPAAKGATTRTGRVGYACAFAIRDTAGSAAAPAARCRNCRRGSFMTLPPYASAMMNSRCSLDHLFSAGEQQGRHGDAERLRCGQIHHQLVLGRRLHRQLAGTGALEDAVDIAGCASKYVGHVAAVRHQAAARGKGSEWVDRRQPTVRRQGMSARWFMTVTSGSTISPPLGSCAKASSARSISARSLTATRIGVVSKEGAAASSGPQNKSANGAVFGLNTIATRVTCGATTLSISSHLLPIENSKLVKPVR